MSESIAIDIFTPTEIIIGNIKTISPISVSIDDTGIDNINSNIEVKAPIEIDVVTTNDPINITVAMASFLIGGSTTVSSVIFVPIVKFSNETYVYFVGHYGDGVKVNRWDLENNLEFRLTQTAPTTIEECQTLF